MGIQEDLFGLLRLYGLVLPLIKTSSRKLQHQASTAQPPPTNPRPPPTKADRPKPITPYNTTAAYDKEKHSKYAKLTLQGVSEATAETLAKPKKTELTKPVHNQEPAPRPITRRKQMEDFFINGKNLQ